LGRRWRPSARRILTVLADGRPKAQREIVKAAGMSEGAVWAGLRRCWQKGLVLRSRTPLREKQRVFKGRAGVRVNLRSYYLYLLNSTKAATATVGGMEFVQYASRFLDQRNRSTSKASLILNFLRDHVDKAYFSKMLADLLKSKGVKISDIMANVRRFERAGLIYVRGYRTNERQTPFKEGYLLTYIDPNKPREMAIEEAVQRTEEALTGRAATSPIMSRVHRIHDLILAASKTHDLPSQSFIMHELGCTEYETEGALQRALQLYPKLKELKLFNAYNYYYHDSMSPEDLQATITMKENYIRIEKGRDLRVGHNWEAAVEWFVDKFTPHAAFQQQTHRTAGMDPRRITLHLIKPVGKRRQNAEVDRVWTITSGLFSPVTTNVLECKWGLVRKGDIDDFFEVLRWSQDYGVDASQGRRLKQGVTGLFAGSAFNPQEKVSVRGETMSLATYANRLNIRLLKTADFNEQLRKRGCKRNITTQSICKAAKDEKEVREILEAIWRKPVDAEGILKRILHKNEETYRFERMLNEEPKKPSPPATAQS